MVSAVSLLVKRHGRFYRDAVLLCANSVEHGSDISVIPDIVSASSIYRNGCNRRNLLIGLSNVMNAHIHDFHVVVQRDKRSDLRLQFVFARISFYCLPHQACG